MPVPPRTRRGCRVRDSSHTTTGIVAALEIVRNKPSPLSAAGSSPASLLQAGGCCLIAGSQRRLAVADELSRGTIDTVLAKPDLELGIEALMRGMQP
jgi:hypothetical protein